MHHFRTMALGTLVLTGLAACGESDDAFKASYRTRLTQACTQASGPGAAEGQRICTCMIDRYVANTPVSQLRAEKDQTAMPAAAQQALQQCTQEAMQRQLGGRPAPTLNTQ